MPTMETIALGSQGLKVSKLGYGCMGLTTAYGAKLPDEDIVAMLEKVYEQGVTFWDTASIYAVRLWFVTPLQLESFVVA